MRSLLGCGHALPAAVSNRRPAHDPREDARGPSPGQSAVAAADSISPGSGKNRGLRKWGWEWKVKGRCQGEKTRG
jgi:hypothetical protein